MTALARLIALWCVTVSVASTNAQMELSTGSHIPYAASSAYLANIQSTGAALDTKGVLHQGTEYSGVPPWLNALSGHSSAGRGNRAGGRNLYTSQFPHGKWPAAIAYWCRSTPRLPTDEANGPLQSNFSELAMNLVHGLSLSR
jgi:hypothetical protein